MTKERKWFRVRATVDMTVNDRVILKGDLFLGRELPHLNGKRQWITDGIGEPELIMPEGAFELVQMVAKRAKRYVEGRYHSIRKGEIAHFMDETEDFNGKPHFRYPTGRTYTLYACDDFVDPDDPSVPPYVPRKPPAEFVKPKKKPNPYANNPLYGAY